MEFSGRTDYWIYVLKTARIPADGCVVPPEPLHHPVGQAVEAVFLEASEAYLSLRSEVKIAAQGARCVCPKM